MTEAAVSGAAVPQGGASQGAVSPGTVFEKAIADRRSPTSTRSGRRRRD
ncbi:hypothetical protein IOD13_00235 [Brevibacterium casei]|nr:hypothetical protein [Brevibacterium casei]